MRERSISGGCARVPGDWHPQPGGLDVLDSEHTGTIPDVLYAGSRPLFSSCIIMGA